MLAELIYAVLVTILAISSCKRSAKLAQREADFGPEAMIAKMRGKKPGDAPPTRR